MTQDSYLEPDRLHDFAEFSSRKTVVVGRNALVAAARRVAAAHENQKETASSARRFVLVREPKTTASIRLISRGNEAIVQDPR